jgi:LysM repeat protein
MREYASIQRRFNLESKEKEQSLSYKSAIGYSLGLHILIALGVLCVSSIKAKASENIDTNFLKKLEEDYKRKSKYTKTYIVKRGDTIGEIARKYHLVTKRLLEMNNIKDEGKIKEGQVLKFM